MAKKRDSDERDRKLQGEKAVSRRDFVKKGAAGVSAAVLSTSGTALAQVSPAQAIQWTYEADIVIIGGGCTGLPAAIRARDLGASVIVLDQRIDLRIDVARLRLAEALCQLQQAGAQRGGARRPGGRLARAGCPAAGDHGARQSHLQTAERHAAASARRPAGCRRRRA